MAIYDKLMKRTLVFTMVFAAVALCTVFYYAAARESKPVLPEGNPDSVIRAEVPTGPAKELKITEDKNRGEYLCIPFSDNMTEDKILFENHYMDQLLYITAGGTGAEFYEENGITGNSSYTGQITCRSTAGGVRLELALNNLYEHEAFYKNNTLYLRFLPPGEKQEKIIVVDAAGGDEVSLAIVSKVKEKLDATDIRAYYTRLNKDNPTLQKRIRLANASMADMLVSLTVGTDEDSPGAGGISTVYNSTFFIPDFSSVDLADIMERAVAAETGGRVDGLKASGGTNLLVEQAAVPVAAVEIGALSYEKDRENLMKEDYQEKVAEGIFQGILEAYGQMEAQKGK